MTSIQPCKETDSRGSVADDLDRPAAPERRRFSRGTTIFKEGDVADVAYIVESGKVDIMKVICGRRVLLGTVPQWGIFGELGVLDNSPRMAAATTAEETVCLVVRPDAIATMLDGAPQGLVVLIQSMAKVIRQSGEDLATARFRLAELGHPVV